MNGTPHGDVLRALRSIPSGRFVLTAEFEGSRKGAHVRWVQRCSVEPPMVMLSIQKGNLIAPLIRDSRRFGLCQLSAGERHLLKRFEVRGGPDDDPFVGLEVRRSPGGAPILEQAVAYLDCELVRHVDIESDHELYVGLAVHGAVLRGEEPEVIVGEPDPPPPPPAAI